MNEMKENEIFDASFPATMEGLEAGTAFLDKIVFNPRIGVIFDEIASNVVRCSGASDFHVRVIRGENLTLIVSDSGTPFDPTKAEDPDVTASAEDRKIGGLGLFLVKKMSKSFSYERKDDRNVVTVVL